MNYPAWRTAYYRYKLQVAVRASKKTVRKRTLSLFSYRVSFYHFATIKLLFEEIFVEKHYKFKATSTAPVIIDCGANIGLSVLYFKQEYPEAKVLAFEANPFAHKLLNENIEQNGLKSVYVHQVALHDHKGTQMFFMGQGADSVMASFQNVGQGNGIPVKTQLLSSYIGALPRIDLIKMDVEGAEISIVNDLQTANLLAKPEQYLIEYHHYLNQPAQFSGFLQKFEAAGFQYKIRRAATAAKTIHCIVIHFFKHAPQ